MSRVCVKNIPRYITDEKLREHFASRGEVTDAKVIKTKDGRSRQFGFVGFRTEDEANSAAKYFDRTYFDNSRLSCEVAYGIGDPNLPRPWSRHSQGSSAYEKTHRANEPSSSGSEVQKKAQRSSNGKDTVEPSDSKLAEFLEVMQPRNRSKFWANDTAAGQQKIVQTKKEGKRTVKVEASTVPAVLRKVPIGKGEGSQKLTRLHVRYDDSSDDEPGGTVSEFQLEADGNGEHNEVAETPLDEVVKDETVSDLAYLQSRMTREWSDSDEDEEGTDDGAPHRTLEGNGAVVKQLEQEKSTVENFNGGLSGSPGLENDVDRGHQADTTDAAVVIEEPHEVIQDDKELTAFEEQESLSETGRLFLRNLPYTASEEDIRELFSKYGELSEVHLVLDKDTKRSQGLAFVLFMFPEAAVRALKDLDKKIFQGRLLHILPARRALPSLGKEENGSGKKPSKFAQKKNDERTTAEAGGRTTAWNAFFMNPDTVAESVAQQYGMAKGDFLDPEADDLAVRLALGETHIIAETKRALSREGINVQVMEKLASSGDKDVKRSNYVILVKNLPFTTMKSELMDMFSTYGTLGRVVLPPTKTLALVEFLEAADARKAFRGLAYKRFKHVPLYLEWAPDDVLMPRSEGNPQGNVEQEMRVNEEQLAPTDVEADLDHAQARSVFVKNLNFATSDTKLRNHIQQYVKGTGAIRSVKINMKPSKNGKLLSMGFGFAEFDSVEMAKEICQLLQGTVLDGHALVVQLSHRSDPKRLVKPGLKADKKASSTKVIIRNVAFEATKKEIRQLVSPFGQIKSLRLPKKFDGNHRGFAFVEFVTRQEAQNAFDALQNTHLYGRHLVLEHAKEGETLEDLRARTLKQMLENESGEKHTRPAKKRRVLDDDAAVSFGKLLQ